MEHTGICASVYRRQLVQLFISASNIDDMNIQVFIHIFFVLELPGM